MPRMRQTPLTVPRLIVVCLGTGAWACVAALTHTSCRFP